jgi:hypothetical protein
MQVEYNFDVYCNCPVDGLPDVYKVTLHSNRTIPVEEILSHLEFVKTELVFQEELTQNLHRVFNCKVVSYGLHSGVRTKVIAGY